MKPSIQSVLDTTAKRFREQFTESPHHHNSIVIGVAAWEIEEFIHAEQLAVLEAVREEVSLLMKTSIKSLSDKGVEDAKGYYDGLRDLLSPLDLTRKDL